jgi:hypothetical protein
MGVTIDRNSRTMTYYLDQKIMSTVPYKDTYTLQGMALEDFPVHARGTVTLGGQFIGTIRDAFIDTDAGLPFEEKYVRSGQLADTYGTCEPYSVDMADQGVCEGLIDIGDPIYVSPQRWSATMKALVDGVATIGLFVSESCRDQFLKYVCSSTVMPCVEQTIGGKDYAFPQSPCQSQCQEFIGSCRADLLANIHIIHSIPAMRMYGEEMLDTWCDIRVDATCSSEEGAPFCMEQFRINSGAAYVDVFQEQPGNPIEGHFVPGGAFVPCASNDKVYVAEVSCPGGFSPYGGDESEDLCVFPCVSFLFDSRQIDTMWAAYVATGLMGLATNICLVLVAATELKIKKSARKLPPFVTACAALGLVYNLVDTLPVAILKEELPCANDCDDEFCHGDGWLCKAQQPSEYLLLAVFIILLRTLTELFMKAVLSFSARKIQTISSAYTKITAVITGVLVVFCLLADSELLASGSSQYRQLIVARDSFSCAPRFSSAVQEHLLLTIPFMMVCLALVGIVVTMVYNIWTMMKKTPGATAGNTMSKFGKVAGKLLILACVVALLWLIRVCVTAVQQPLIEGFNVDSQAFADCTFQAAMSSTWQAANNGRVELCSPIPNTGDTMLASKLLMICVKNTQGWVVGVVWGISLLATKTSSSRRRGSKSTAKISSAVSSSAGSSTVVR